MADNKRPGLLTFASIMMFLVALFNLVSGIAILLNLSVVDNLKVDFGNNAWIIGVVDLLIAAGCVYGGYSLLKGGKFGYYWTMTFALINGMKWFFMLPWQPFLGIVMLGVDIVILYALATNPEFFGLGYLGEYSPTRNYD